MNTPTQVATLHQDLVPVVGTGLAETASTAVAARARGPSSWTSADSVSGPRELLTTTA